MCTAIVACCILTYRPLIERVFGTGASAKGSKGSKASSSHHSKPRVDHTRQGGWREINVQHDIVMTSKPAHTVVERQRPPCATCGGNCTSFEYGPGESECVAYSGFNFHPTGSQDQMWVQPQYVNHMNGQMGGMAAYEH